MTDAIRMGLLCAIATFVAAGCAPRQAATTWGYSHWVEKFGAGDMGEFEKAQRACLQQVGASADPASVAPDSAEEDGFIACMNAADWCTMVYHCQKPGE